MRNPDARIFTGIVLIAMGLIIATPETGRPSPVPSPTPLADGAAPSPSGPLSAAITGTVTSDELAPLELVAVRAYRGGDVVASTITSNDGRFRLELPQGTYRVRFSPPTQTFADQYWPDSDSLVRAADVVVGKTSIAVVQVMLRRTYLISGKVTTSDGAAVAARVYPLRSVNCCGWATSATTSTGGTYGLRVAAGTYRLLIVPFRGFSLGPKWLGGGSTWREARDLEVKADLSGVDATVSGGAFAISGKITKPSAVSVTVFAYASSMSSCCDQLVAVAPEDANGYNLTLAPGRYVLQFVPQTPTLASRWWEDAQALAGARPITVSTAEVIGIDVTLR